MWKEPRPTTASPSVPLPWNSYSPNGKGSTRAGRFCSALAGACQFGTAWAGSRLIYHHQRHGRGLIKKKRWPDVYKTVRGDVWPSLLKGFDLARVLYDGRDHGGTAETYLSKLQGPMGIIDQPQNLLQLQDEGLDVPFLDAQLKLDPDRRLLSIYIIREIISKRSKEHALSRTRRVSYNTDQKTGR